MDRNAIVRLGIDLYKSNAKTFSYIDEDKEFTADEAVDVLRQALIDANGGETKFDYKALRRNKVAIFEIIEELVSAIVMEGLNGSEFWNEYVDYRNLKLGDMNEFEVEDASTFVVAEIADGHATPRRQRLGKATTVAVKTSVHTIRMYEHFSRFMAGRIDWAKLCDKVAEAFQKEIWNDIYTAFAGIAKTDIIGGDKNDTYLVTAGTFDEDELIALIAHVEAATGKKAIVLGTQAALKKVSGATLANASEKAKEDLYNQGFFGKFYGNDMFKLNQIHVPGTDEFLLDDNTVHVVAGDDKFIKFVDEGETIVDDREWTQNSDSTLEYRMNQKFGAAVLFSSKGYGRYKIS